MEILTQLGIDQSFFYQFGVFIVVFFLLKVVLFNKLLFVIETRESKTTKLDSHADSKLGDAEELGKKYQAELDGTNQSAQAMLSSEKEKIKKSEALKIKAGEVQVASKYSEKRSLVESEVAASKDAILGQANQLSNDLVSRLTQ